MPHQVPNLLQQQAADPSLHHQHQQAATPSLRRQQQQQAQDLQVRAEPDRKSTRLNSSHRL